MLKQVDGKWAVVSKETGKPLVYYKGEGKPSKEWFEKQEKRIQFFKHMNEASYAGNIGIMELIKFKQKANDEQKKKFDQHVKSQNHKEAWKLVQHVTGVKLHKSVHEDASEREEGTDSLVKNYKKATPGQNFKEYIKK